MAQSKQKIQPQSSIRLKQLCNELHITQKQLHDATGISENTLSKIATGKGPLTRQVAEEIIKACPTYRIEWLLGFDDSPHNSKVLNMPGVKDLARHIAAIDFLNALGIEIGQVNNAGLFLPASEMRGFMFDDRSIEIRRGNTVIWTGNMQTIENTLLEIGEFALFKINRLEIEERENNG